MIPLPKPGSLEAIFLSKAIEAAKRGEGVTFLDFVGTGITEENIDQVVQNLRNGMYESDIDGSLKEDA